MAQHNLGVCYGNGAGVEQNDVEAVRWYRAAAAQGVADAQSNLGVCYRNGTGVKQDNVEAVRWYRAAAEQGNAGAQFNLGTGYVDGTGVEQNDVEAVRWFRLLPNKGMQARSMYNLGVMHCSGKGVPADCAESGCRPRGCGCHRQPHTPTLLSLPPGTRVKLVGHQAAILNGMEGAVNGDAGGLIVCSQDGKIAVTMDRGARTGRLRLRTCRSSRSAKAKPTAVQRNGGGAGRCSRGCAIPSSCIEHRRLLVWPRCMC